MPNNTINLCRWDIQYFAQGPRTHVISNLNNPQLFTKMNPKRTNCKPENSQQEDPKKASPHKTI